MPDPDIGSDTLAADSKLTLSPIADDLHENSMRNRDERFRRRGPRHDDLRVDPVHEPPDKRHVGG